MSKYVNIWSFLTIFCLCYFIESITYTYVVTSVQSIEKQFQISSRHSGTLISAGDIGIILTVVLLAYLGGKGNQTRWIGGGLMLMALACFLVALPGLIFLYHSDPSMEKDAIFINVTMEDVDSLQTAGEFQEYASNVSTFTYPYELLPDWLKSDLSEYAKNMLGHCSPVGNKVKSRLQQLRCMQDQTNTLALGTIFVGIMLIGIGHSMPWSLGVPLIDDYVKKRNTPLYFGGIFLIRILGPMAGFVLGGSFAKLYLTLGAPPSGLTPKDPRWIGAWWLGFLVIAAALVVPSILIFLFPSKALAKIQAAKNEEKGTDSHDGAIVVRNSRLSSVERHGEKQLLDNGPLPHKSSMQPPQDNNKVVSEIKAFATSLKAVVKSPVYMGALVGRLFDAMAFKGYFVFLPKYLETQFDISMSRANMFLGIFAVLAFALGVGAGSLVLRTFKLSARRAALLVGMCSLIDGMLSFSQMGVGCTSVVSRVGREAEAVRYNFNLTCNAGCECDPIGLLPVCSPSGEAFYNPCVAGCKNYTSLDPDYLYDNCSCANGTQLSRQFCKEDCTKPLVIYFALSVVTGIIAGIGVIPGILLILRSVPVANRSVALGFSAFCVNLLSTLPSPIIFGYVIDTACLHWGRTCDGSTGSCEIYDPKQLRYRSHIFNGALHAVALLFDIWVWYWSKDVILMDPKTDENALALSVNAETDKPHSEKA